MHGSIFVQALYLLSVTLRHTHNLAHHIPQTISFFHGDHTEGSLVSASGRLSYERFSSDKRGRSCRRFSTQKFLVTCTFRKGTH